MALIVACAGELPPELKNTGGNDTGGAPANTGGSNNGTGGGNGGTGGMVTGTGGGSAPQNCSMAMQILSDQCAACHATASASFGNLDLLSDGVASRLVGKAAYSAGSCKGKGNLLDANSNPATGIFVDKITNMTPKCGSVMPLGQKMSQDKIDCLTQWATYLAAGNN